MTVTIQSTDLIGAGDQFTFAADGDSLHLLEGVTIASTTAEGIEGDGLSDLLLTINGTVIGAEDEAIDFANTDRSSIVIGEGAYVTSSRANNFYFGIVFTSGDETSIVNNGEIYAPKANAVRARSELINFENTGTIFGLNGAAIFDSSSTTSTNIANSGEISAGFNALNTDKADAIYVESGVTEIHNTGSLSAIDDDASGVRLGDGAVSSDGSRVVNHGDIASLRHFGVDFSEMSDTESATLINYGTISGGTAAFNGNDSGEVVVNGGRFIGDVLLNGGDDTYDGRGGTVASEIRGGTGNDTYILGSADENIVENAGEGVDTVKIAATFGLAANFENLDLLGSDDIDGFGNSEDNEIDGNAGRNRLYGESGNDELFGAANDDRVFGGTGDDTVGGGRGNDQVFGETGNDDLKGHEGADRLLGGAGNDDLGGGSGNDTLFGGGGFDKLVGSTGDDRLTGDGNADKFIFTDFGGGFGNDIITDFDATNDFEDINLAGVASITNFADLTANHMSQVGANVVIDDLAGNTITVLNVTLAQMNAADFIF